LNLRNLLIFIHGSRRQPVSSPLINRFLYLWCISGYMVLPASIEYGKVNAVWHRLTKRLTVDRMTNKHL